MTETAPENPDGPVHFWQAAGFACGIVPDGKQVTDDVDQVTCKNCRRAK